jgi:hypothetical protein
MSAPVDSLSREQLLDRFQATAGCMHTQCEAQSVMLRLRFYITERQYGFLGTAWSHHCDVGLGREELDAVCEEIRQGKDGSLWPEGMERPWP